MAEAWFCTRQGTESGPFTSAQLKQLADAGQLQPGDEVWKGGMTKRVPARAIKGLFAAETSAKSPAARAATTQAEELVELIAAEPEPMPQPYPQPAYGQPPMSPAAPTHRPAPVAGPMRAEVVEDEPEPTASEPVPRRRKKRKRVGGGLGLWLGIGGGAVALLVLVLVLIFTLSGSGGNPRVTRANFDKLHPGVTEDQAINLLGTPDESSTNGNVRFLSWRSSTHAINMNFTNGGATGAYYTPWKGKGSSRGP